MVANLTRMSFRLFVQMIALHSTTKKKPFEKFIGKLPELGGRMVSGWLEEENTLAVYATIQGGGSVGFALGHLTHFDPLGEHRRPYVLDFVYVSSQHRRQRIGTRVMMAFLAEVDYQCTAFCVDKGAVAFHESCGFRLGQESEQVTMMRHAYRLRVDRSPGKGLGVFAVTSFKKGEMVAMYPDVDAETELHHDEYLLRVGDKFYTGRPWEGRVPSYEAASPPSNVAHLFNDCAKIVCRDEWPGLRAWCDDANNYTEESIRGANVSNEGRRFVATRDVAAGEEILYSYGAMYWTDRLYKASYIGKLIVIGCLEMESSEEFRKVLKSARFFDHHNVNMLLFTAYMSVSGALLGKQVPSQIATALSTEIGKCVIQVREPMTREQLKIWQMRMRNVMEGFNRLRSMPDLPEEQRRKLAELILASDVGRVS